MKPFLLLIQSLIGWVRYDSLSMVLRWRDARLSSSKLSRRFIMEVSIVKQFITILRGAVYPQVHRSFKGCSKDGEIGYCSVGLFLNEVDYPKLRVQWCACDDIPMCYLEGESITIYSLLYKLGLGFLSVPPSYKGDARLHRIADRDLAIYVLNDVGLSFYEVADVIEYNLMLYLAEQAKLNSSAKPELVEV